MYVDPFVMGVVATLLVEIVLVLAAAATHSARKGGPK